MSDKFDSVQLLKSFAEAGSALEALPKVQADLRAAQDLIDELNAKLAAEQSKTSLLQDSIETLHTELTSKEAALADATKSLGERDETIANVHRLLGLAIPKAPESEVSATTTTEGDNMGQSETDPTLATVAQSTEESNSGSGVSSEPTFHPETESPSPLTPPQPEPSSSMTKAGEEADGTQTTNNGTSADAEAQAPDYTNVPHWQKPGHVSWDEFRSHGGVVPDWVEDQTFQNHPV